MCNAVVESITSHYSLEKIKENNCSDETTPNIIMDSEDIEGVTEMHLVNKIITDITGIEYFTSLTNLSLNGNQITDLTPLSNLTSLTDLLLYDNQISDLTPLSNLANLDNLYLDYNQISDLAPLSNLTNLTDLELRENQVSDLTPLSNLTSLTYLELRENQISDLSPLSSLVNLEYLNVATNSFLDITPILQLNLNETPFFEGNPPIVGSFDTTNNKEYVLPSSYQFLNTTLDVTPVADWVIEGQNMLREWRDMGMFKSEIQNATMNEDGKSITILDTNDPAVVSFYIIIEDERIPMAQLTVIYEEPVGPDDPTSPTDDPAVPNTGENNKSAGGNVVLNILSCVVPAIIMMGLVMKRFCDKKK